MLEESTSPEKRILEQLYADGFRTPDEIADRVNLDADTVREKITDWEDSGLLTKPVAVVDPAKIGFPVASYHFINFQKNYDHAINQGLRKFSRWPGTKLAMVVLGDYDVIARKVSQSEQKLDLFATNVLSNPDIELDETFGPQASQIYNIETTKITQVVRRDGLDFPVDRQRSPPKEVDLTEPEAAILNQLQRDAKLRSDPADIASRVAMTREEVEATIDRFEEEDIIAKYARRIDQDVGGWYRAFFGISVERGRYDDIVEKLTEVNTATAPFIQSGLGHNWADIFIELVFSSIEELDAITDDLRSFSGVKSSRTFLGTRCPYYDESVEASSSAS